MRNQMISSWKKIVVVIIGLLAVFVLTGVFSAISAANTVPVTWANKNDLGINANAIKPWECAGIKLTNIVDIGAGQTGTSANDLILGTDKADPEIRGGAGDDCILGGKGNERQKIGQDWGPGIFGEEGNDVIIGGPGNNDHCDGGPGNDTYYSCETCDGDCGTIH
jgi:hypothetical protein